MKKFVFTLLLVSMLCLSVFAQVGSSKGGITPSGTLPIVTPPKGTLHSLLSRSGYVIGYDFKDAVVFSSNDRDKIARIVEADNGDIYLYNPISKWETGTWIKLSKEKGDTLVARFPQPLFMEDGETFYAFPLFYDGEKNTYTPKSLNENEYLAESKFTYKNGELKQIDDAMISLVMPDYTWMDSGDSHLLIAPVQTAQNKIPESAKDKIKEYIVSYDKGGENLVSAVVKGVIDGNKVYLGNPQAPGDQWFVGTKEGENVTFATNQYLGPDTVKTGYHIFFRTAAFTLQDITDDMGYQVFKYDYTEVPSITLRYQQDADMYAVSENFSFVITSGEDMKGLNLPAFYEYKDVAATPKNPSFAEFQLYNEEYRYGIFNFNIPTLDINNKYLNPQKLFFCFYIDDDVEPHVFYKRDYKNMPTDSMSIFPNDYNDHYDMAPLDELTHQMYYYFEDFEKIGVQSIYRGGNEERKSDIVWITKEQVTHIGTASINSDKQIVSESFYDMTGRKVAHPSEGVFIKQVTYSDNTTGTYKVIVRK